VTTTLGLHSSNCKYYSAYSCNKFYFYVSILNNVYINNFIGNNHGSQIRDNGHKYATVQAVKCCRKAAYRASNTPLDNSNPVAHSLASVNDLFEHALRNVDGSDMVGITIQNQVNQNDKPIGNKLCWFESHYRHISLCSQGR